MTFRAQIRHGQDGELSYSPRFNCRERRDAGVTDPLKLRQIRQISARFLAMHKPPRLSHPLSPDFSGAIAGGTLLLRIGALRQAFQNATGSFSNGSCVICHNCDVRTLGEGVANVAGFSVW
jgi:hypothetical protein